MRFWAAGATGDSATPRIAFDGDSAHVPVLGLLPSTAYVLRAVLYAGVDSAVSDTLRFTTGALPADLPSFTTSGSDPLPGYVVFGVSPFAIVNDNTGRVVWYHRFPTGGPGRNAMAQPRGVYIGQVLLADTTQKYFLLLDALGDSVGAVRCGDGKQLRLHDAILQPDGTSWVLCEDTRTMNLTAAGGLAAAQVTATVVQHVDAAGAVLFEWNAFDHSLSEITRINTQTGAVLWRMGGPAGQFAFGGASGSGFSRARNVRVVGPNSFIVLANLGGAVSRFERYAWSTAGMSATLQQSNTSTPGVVATVGGSVQRAAPTPATPSGRRRSSPAARRG